MIIIKIKGGLGNQMFQYAFGRYISLKLQKELKLDLSFFKEQSYRKFVLDSFYIPDLKKLSFYEFVPLKLQNYFPNLFRPFVLIKDNNLKSFNKNKDYYIDGYWQSERYFYSIKDVIKKEFKLKNALKEKNKKLIYKILNTNSVSLHVRRGDYVSIPQNKNYNVCDTKYYYKALDIIKKKVINPYCFVFSDDLFWVKENFKFDIPVIFVEGNNETIDLYLMSLCKHNIMANSTFSWWGSWLNENPNKIVVSPYYWRINEIRNELITSFQIRI